MLCTVYNLLCTFFIVFFFSLHECYFAANFLFTVSDFTTYSWNLNLQDKTNILGYYRKNSVSRKKNRTKQRFLFRKPFHGWLAWQKKHLNIFDQYGSRNDIMMAPANLLTQKLVYEAWMKWFGWVTTLCSACNSCDIPWNSCDNYTCSLEKRNCKLRNCETSWQNLYILSFIPEQH